ncbi:late secretory pathway protein AVL9 homolog isoform X2 [Watersipora subatra]|uniref:late secretory pathway protein AVL9 homolog isoform X2 n=1 Tax=Watersipora subatra TaxID=2589382 RepID=UPI00355B8A72
MASHEKSLLHIIVVGFHHKKGCQVEFAYPPLVEGTGEESGEVPLAWKYLPTLALPDGAHNYSKDTVYFLLKNKDGSRKSTVYGVSCYRQIDAKDIVNKTEDITRETVMKSVCVLTTLPCFGAVAAKLEVVTHAWFDQKDFTRLQLLREAYDSLSVSISSLSVESQVCMGLRLNELVKLYRHKILVLFKLLMLERKTVFYMTPVSDLCNVLLSLLSLFPGLLELGLVEGVQSTKTPAASPAVKEDCHDKYFSGSRTATNGDDKPDTQTSKAEDETALNMSATKEHVVRHSIQSMMSHSSVSPSHSDPHAGDSWDSPQLNPQQMAEKEQSYCKQPLIQGKGSAFDVADVSDLPLASVPQLDSEDSILQIDMEDQESFLWDTKAHTLVLTEDRAAHTSADHEDRRGKMEKLLTLGVHKARSVEVVPVVSPTSILINMAGMPLAIFTKGSVCHPYLSLSYYDILEDVNIRSFVIGASNVLFKQKRQNIDVLVEDDPAGIMIFDKELQRHLQLTTEDLRFADMLTNRVDETFASGQFLESSEWEGGDEWIRAQFKDYLQALMATVLADDAHLLDAFNSSFISAWKSTHNYRVWRSTVQQLENVIPGHPCQGAARLNDMKLQLARSERGRKINAAVDQAGKAMTEKTKTVGEALSNVRTVVSSWWATIGASVSATTSDAQTPDSTE